jgi:[ribosomal protein S5]-alanine N-acetyltransferase
MLLTPRLESERLVLRVPEKRDASAVQIMAGHPDVSATIPNIPFPYPDGAALSWIERARQTVETGEGYPFVVTSKRSEELVGACGLQLVKRDRRAELGYWIGKQFWGCGYATEASRRLIRFAFVELVLNRVFAHAVTKNAASIRVLEKSGFVFEGILRQHCRHRGVFEDVACFGMLLSEFDQSREDGEV